MEVAIEKMCFDTHAHGLWDSNDSIPQVSDAACVPKCEWLVSKSAPSDASPRNRSMSIGWPDAR